MATGLIPVNFSVADAHAAAGVDRDPETIQAPLAGELNSWAQEAYSLDVSDATSWGFPVGNLSESYQRQALMFGVSRWKDVTVDRHSYRFGVALRAIIVVSQIKGDGGLTLPVIAAKVEIEGARATAQMLVRGYKGGDLADCLPAWQSFGVDSYGEYMKAVSDIQQLILKTESCIDPELLATSVLSTNTKVPSDTAAAGMVYALHAIANGKPQARAIEQLPSHESGVVDMARRVYRATMGEDEWTVPNEQQRETAEKQLHGLHLGHRPIWNHGSRVPRADGSDLPANSGRRS
jgi:hypothetical protein